MHKDPRKCAGFLFLGGSACLPAARPLRDQLASAQQPGWASETYRKASHVVERCLQPSLKGLDIASLGTPEARKAIAKIAARAPALAQKVRAHFGSIAEFAIHSGCAKRGGICP
ncbi:phage integrase central domain-containing protein [Lysobacter gummosus]|uniref:phage integrase central domain-containing protein n=1 Tax=Lysobacter TaxID=68 RepID=UPI003CCCB18B